MRLLPSDPDIETIVTRIENRDIDLQPEFQRGEVWSRSKKQRLIDSILRDWHVPPIHVIELSGTRKQEVLDGQQRLAAIRDFCRGEFPIDGTIEPDDAGIAQLDGLKFRDLPPEWRRKFNQFTIRVFRIVDYLSAEPGELFFRLNQPTSLTGAEQRNAFYGPVRAQIKELVAELAAYGIDKSILGFSNARMAYDDVLSRVAVALERGTLSEKVTSSVLADLYRSEKGLSDETIDRLKAALGVLSDAKKLSLSGSPTFNKATLFSWLLFVIRAKEKLGNWLTPRLLAEFLSAFEGMRVLATLVGTKKDAPDAAYAALNRLFDAYDSRSTARVADVSSVLLRDITIWLAFEKFLADQKQGQNLEALDLGNVRVVLKDSPSLDEDSIARLLLTADWGHVS